MNDKVVDTKAEGWRGFFSRFKMGGSKPADKTPAREALAHEEAAHEEIAREETVHEEIVPKKTAPLKERLAKTRHRFSEGLQHLFLGAKTINDDLLQELEALLLSSDVGVATTAAILERLTGRISRQELGDSKAVHEGLKSELRRILKPVERPLEIDRHHQPFVILMVGVNGVGKTTTIGKLARKFRAEGKSVLLAAGDTFRAAAVEQLKVWGERNDIAVVSQGQGADSASVIYDAFASARARGIDVLIADTAGRLHNKKNLMGELAKINRVLTGYDESAPHEVMLVLDAGTGQNAIAQVTEFRHAVSVSGLVLSKLDGTARGGVIFALAGQLGLPIRYIGVGEQLEDLRTFSADEFVNGLFD